MDILVWKSPSDPDVHPIISQSPPILLFSLFFESISESLDFYDLSMLLMTGDSSLRNIIMTRTRSIRMGYLKELNMRWQGHYIPMQALSTFCSFQGLERLEIIGYTWILPQAKTSALLNLPSTLRHITLRAELPGILYFTHLLDVPWSTKFPQLESLRLFVLCFFAGDRHVLSQFFRVSELPKSLRVLSLWNTLSGFHQDLLWELLAPIGYSAQDARNKEAAATINSWNEAYDYHSPEQRASFQYHLPNLRHIDFYGLDRRRVVADFPTTFDFSVAVPSLQAANFDGRLIGDPLSELDATTAKIANLPPHPVIAASRPSSLLTVSGYSFHPSQTLPLPPSLTKLRANHLPSSATIKSHFPRLFDLSVVGSTHNSLISSDASPLTYLESSTISLAPTLEHRIRNLRVMLIPRDAPDYGSISDVVEHLEIDEDRYPMHGPFFVNPIESRLRHLSLSYPIKSSFLDTLPRNLESLSVNLVTSDGNGSSGPLTLSGLPPSLTYLRIFTARQVGYIEQDQLAFLPRSLRFCLLPYIFIAATFLAPVQPPAPPKQGFFESLFGSTPKPAPPQDIKRETFNKHNFLAVLNLLPPECTYGIRFVTNKDYHSNLLEVVPDKEVSTALRGSVYKTRF